MYEIEIPSGVSVAVSGDEVTVKGKLGSVAKHTNPKFVEVNVQGSKITISEVKERKLARKSALATKAFSSVLKGSIDGVQNGIEVKMKVLFAHFPTSIEIKGNKMYLKNLFGEQLPR